MTKKDPDTLRDEVPEEVRAAYEKFLRAERRDEPRAPLHLKVMVQVGGDPAQTFEAKTANIGASGMCLVTDQACEVGLPLSLRINVSAKVAYEVTGSVSWVHKGSAVGVRFEELPPETEAELTALVDNALVHTPPPLDTKKAPKP